MRFGWFMGNVIRGIGIFRGLEGSMLGLRPGEQDFDVEVIVGD